MSGYILRMHEELEAEMARHQRTEDERAEAGRGAS